MQQDQLDDIFFNHLAIPGMININTEVGDPLASGIGSDASLDGPGEVGLDGSGEVNGAGVFGATSPDDSVLTPALV